MAVYTLPLVIPKKRRVEEVPELEAESDRLDQEAKTARQRLGAHSFNAEFWTKVAEVETIILQKTSIASEISLARFTGPESKWEEGEEAKKLFQQIRAHRHLVSSFTAYSECLTTSSSGMGIARSGARKRDNRQTEFRRQLLADYASLDPTRLLCVTMDAIFGKTELISSENGFIVSSTIKEHFDSGIFVIVPDEIRNFKIKIIDKQWPLLNCGIFTLDDEPKWKDLDGRKLVFRGTCRPAARYLYFHYCLQLLRRAWKAGPGEEAAAWSLQDELAEPLRAVPGRYISKNMLQAFIDELGHEYKDLLLGSKAIKDRASLLLDTAAVQITDSDRTSDSSEESDDDY
ncbi:hypothetical protein ASPZODRAFT_2118784 [Penicilliopsis zonata CBS 506.65]|uniref:HNH nuclease domain-containing protein n=1 Tax=Penicilliopsis zonata CBS 506.65 TaxID=1073090 RepID=A0A1L9S6Y3_9EURO|nr:hypothetical protein ASPZODRAFT_2118784 [Penicilliopsis zonata CBS 506.65]OJJ42924.1 hypothetical protein ASPZODRAFT_2118784 [Penicilliopsis zonata CBS 506.65]